ncbi:hypothetical protein Ndes2526B_g04790 [Nannochloris sp. 'desiccata']|nr:hypothetical protein NADE_003465 [Chlorella desiccata (nom. nud.)]
MDLDNTGMDFSLPDIETESDRIYLGNAVQERLQGYFGPGYNDVSLSKYIVVMLSNKTTRQVIEKSLVEFLGPKDATNCSDWLFSNFHSLLSRRSAQATTDNHSALYNVDYPEPTRHIRSTVNLPNIDRNNRKTGFQEKERRHHRGGSDLVLSRPNKDWYANAGQGHGEGVETKQEEIAAAAAAAFGEGGHVWGKRGGNGSSIEPMFTEEQLQSLTMRVPMKDDISANTRKNNNKKERRKHKLPHGIQDHAITKGKQRRVRQQERSVVTINGRPAGRIGANHSQVEQFRNRANSLNPNNAAFYAATPKSECSVLVKGIPRTATNPIIRVHFAALCGPVPRVSILKRPISGENSDLAWVSLRNEKSAQDALMLNGSTMLLEQIHVWPKESEEARREVAKMNKDSMNMYMPDPEMVGWGEEAVDRSRFKYVRGENGRAAGDRGHGGRGVGAPTAMEIQTSVVVKEEGF